MMWVSYKQASFGAVGLDANKRTADKRIDYAIFDITPPGSEGKGLRIGDSSNLHVGDQVTVIGYPNHQEGNSPYRHSMSIDDLVTSLTQEMLWEMRDVILQTGKSAIAAFPDVVWWLVTELAETPGREIMQSKYWYKMCEMIEEGYQLSCSADKRLWYHPEMKSRIMVRARFLLGGTLYSLAALMSERFQGDEEDLFAILLEEATQLEQEVQKLCE